MLFTMEPHDIVAFLSDSQVLSIIPCGTAPYPVENRSNRELDQ